MQLIRTRSRPPRTCRPELLAVLGAALLGLGACQRESSAPDSASQTPLHTVELFGGQQGRLPVRPLRVIAGTASVTSFVVALLDDERIAAIPEQAFDYSAAPLSPDDWRGRTFAQFRGEDLLAFAPDLVLMDRTQSVDTKTVLTEVGVSLLVLPDANSFPELLEVVRVLGRVLAVEERAAELVADLERRREALRAEAAQRGEALSALSYTNYGSGGFCAGRGTTADLVFELVGVANAAAERQGHTQVSFEGLYRLDPDLLVVGSSQGSATESATAGYLRGDEGVAALRAVREDRIIVLPARLFSANSQYVMDAAESLAAQLR